ncbi:phosphoribosylanthranilate isomerase [Marinicella meishanensis]|uniref:phosphoribosylanthranilate isomerase n=1 Tax=Marinicella meishanensis TaxID=2873263 RepID=UPI001CC14971|nr:phosphoribosylanthranilate isomerase [Marinicella sp. NBU2979]
MNPHLKVCCISSLAEAELAIELGADVLGLVGHMPSGPGIITDDLAARITAAVPPHIETFLLTSQTTAAGVIAHHQTVGSTAIQLVDELPAGAHAIIRKALPGVRLVQVLHVTGPETLAQALAVVHDVDALLLDSGNPDLQVKELGGTGRTHDWSVSQQIVQHSPVPVFLAGGLNPDNVQNAIKQVQPHGLDLCSGVRTDDQLDRAKLTAFIQQVRSWSA